MATDIQIEKKIELVQAKTTFAYIIAIEDYRFKNTGISSVKYAKNDATKFAQLLKEDFGVLEENITMWLDEDATKSALEDELRYNISQLSKDDRLIFYYAGHGFYYENTNRLTCWDSHPNNLIGTTVSLSDVLFKPLEDSKCIQSLVFLDCCAVQLAVDINSRDLISNLSPQKLNLFIRPDRYNALFMSCAPGEKSYPSSSLQHGIWTWHLIEALKGNIPEATIKEKYITDTSLKNYLSLSVPEYITHKTTHKSTQHPYAKIDASNEFLIRELPDKPEEEITSEIPKLKLDFNSVVFTRLSTVNIRKGLGFKPASHFAPVKITPSGNSFIQGVFLPDVEEEVQEIYAKAKVVFALRSKSLSVAAVSGSGSVDCPAFRYSIEVEQNPDNPSEALVTRKLTIRVKRTDLPANFDSIFSKPVNQVIIPIKQTIDFDDLVEQFENLQDIEGGRLEDRPLSEELDYFTSTGIQVSLSLKDKTITVTPNKIMKFLQFVDNSTDGLNKISDTKANLLG